MDARVKRQINGVYFSLWIVMSAFGYLIFDVSTKLDAAADRIAVLEQKVNSR